MDVQKALWSESMPLTFCTCMSTGLPALRFPNAHQWCCSGTGNTDILGKLRWVNHLELSTPAKIQTILPVNGPFLRKIQLNSWTERQTEDKTLPRIEVQYVLMFTQSLTSVEVQTDAEQLCEAVFGQGSASSYVGTLEC